MKIFRLQAQNFKSFDTVDVEPGDFNVFIGANASGKSNFLSILTFLRDIARDGLEEAVSQGGAGLIQNVQLQDSEFTDFGVWIDWSETQSIRYIEDLEFRVDSTHYQLTLREEGPDGFQIAKDEFTSQLELLNESDQPLDEVGNRLVVRRKNGRLSVEQGGDSLERAGAATYDHSVIPEDSPSCHFVFPGCIFSESKDLASLPIFDFDSSGLGTGSPISGPSKLTEDGSNVALVLRNLLQNSEQRRTFLNLARTLLPFVDDLDARSLTGESTLFFLQESYAEDTYLPASVLSGGTMKIIVLLIALYFDDWPVVAFEEPATSLHPKLISQLMQMMEEVSKDKQIFITTHNPKILRHVDLDDVYLVSRDEDGFSQISKPADKKEVRIFLENDLGIDDLFVQNLL